MSELEAPPRLTGKLKRAFTEREAAHLWRDLDARRVRKPNRTLRLLVSGFAVALALSCLVWFMRPQHDGPLALQDARALPLELSSTTQSPAYHLDDGSQIALAQGAALEVVRNDGTELVTVLRKGKVTFRVKPGGRRRWSIEAGLLSVQVIGTQFVVDRGEHSVSVRVSRGVVLVRSAQLPDGLRRLTAGQSVVVEHAAQARDAAPSPQEPKVVSNGQVSEVDASDAQGKTSVARALQSPPEVLPTAQALPWWVLAERGAFASARARIETEGGIEAVARRTFDPQLLLSLADVAREMHEPQTATVPLMQVLTQAPRSPEATVAAFMLGKLELDALARPRAAAEHFAWVVARGEGALAEDAFARWVEALRASGEGAEARLRATQYLERYPQGRHRTRMKQEAESEP